MSVYSLTVIHAQAMADIHSRCFDRPWPALEMAMHIKRDLCLGLSDPLQSFVIIRRSALDAEILTVATDPEARSLGLAARLLNDAHHRLGETGVETLFLDVAEDNAVARRLYKRLGYQPIGRRPAYYRRGRGRMAAITYQFDLRSLDVTPQAS